MRRSIEYPTAMINGPARLKVMADRPTHTCIPGNRRLSVPADKTGSRAPYTPHRGPTYVRPRCNNTRRVHGVAWSGVAMPWYARWLTLMHARSICCYKTDVPGITLRRYDPHMPPPRNTCALPSPCSPSFVVHHPRVDFRFRVHIFSPFILFLLSSCREV